MLRLPSPFLSASSNVCFSHFGAKLGANGGAARPAAPPSPPLPGQEGVEDPAQVPLPEICEPAGAHLPPTVDSEGWSPGPSRRP